MHMKYDAQQNLLIIQGASGIDTKVMAVIDNVSGANSLNKGKEELFRVSPSDPLKIIKRGERLVADWDTIKWRDCIKLGLAISGPVSDLLGINQSKISYEEVHEIGNEHCTASVVFLANMDKNLYEDKAEKLDKTIISYVNYIYLEGGKNLDLFEASLENDDFEMIVKKHAISFLSENGGKKLTTPLQVNGVSTSKCCSGKFSNKPIVEPQKIIEMKFVGKVVSMNCTKKEIAITDKSNTQTVIAYQDNLFFKELKEILGEPISVTLTGHQVRDPQGRNYLVLDSIDEMESDSGTLI